MNGRSAENRAWLEEFGRAGDACETVVCPPLVYLAQMAQGLRDSGIGVGAQNVSERTAGAWTGEVSAEMLVDSGADWVIVGHSERRANFGETDEIVAAKAARAIEAGLKPIVCVGETLEQREQGMTASVVARQLDALLQRCPVEQLCTAAIAYEPIWAIGTGRTATPSLAQEVHAAIRAQLAAKDSNSAEQVRILYGGSVKPANAAELFRQPDIDGGLIGGASLIAADFRTICAAAE
jgi:triosephosphate isomerase